MEQVRYDYSEQKRKEKKENKTAFARDRPSVATTRLLRILILLSNKLISH